MTDYRKLVMPRPPTWREIVYPLFFTGLFIWIFTTVSGVWWPGTVLGVGLNVAMYVLDVYYEVGTASNSSIGRAGPLVFAGLLVVVGFYLAMVSPGTVRIAGGIAIGFGVTSVVHVAGALAWFREVAEGNSDRRSLFYALDSSPDVDHRID